LTLYLDECVGSDVLIASKGIECVKVLTTCQEVVVEDVCLVKKEVSQMVLFYVAVVFGLLELLESI
jgi:hypothetical protein